MQEQEANPESNIGDAKRVFQPTQLLRVAGAALRSLIPSDGNTRSQQFVTELRRISNCSTVGFVEESYANAKVDKKRFPFLNSLIRLVKCNVIKENKENDRHRIFNVIKALGIVITIPLYCTGDSVIVNVSTTDTASGYPETHPEVRHPLNGRNV